MTDRLEKLESELAAMRPRALPNDLQRQVERAMDGGRKLNWADRSLMSAIVAGTMAACVILTVLLRGEATNASRAPEPALVQANVTMVQYPLLIARADTDAPDELK